MDPNEETERYLRSQGCAWDDPDQAARELEADHDRVELEVLRRSEEAEDDD